MKKTISIILSVLLCMSLASCTSKPEGEKFASYGELLASVQTAADKENFPAIVSKTDEMAQGVFAMLGINEGDVDSFAAACSFMNVSAYCIAIVKPVSGKAADIEAALKNYVELTKSNMENYLPDQFDIAKASKIGKTKNGDIVLVMCENAAEIFDKISASVVE